MPTRKIASTEQLIDLCITATKIRFNRQLETEWIEHSVASDVRHLLQPMFLHQPAAEPSDADRIQEGFVEWPPHFRCRVWIQEKGGVCRKSRTLCWMCLLPSSICLRTVDAGLWDINGLMDCGGMGDERVLG